MLFVQKYVDVDRYMGIVSINQMRVKGCVFEAKGRFGEIFDTIMCLGSDLRVMC
jgi:hypothetical protein